MRRSIVALAAIAVMSLGCSDGTMSPGAPTALTQTDASLSSYWSGHTSASRAVTFVVSGTQVSNFTFAIGGTVECATSTGGFDLGSIGGKATISENAFSFATDSPVMHGSTSFHITVAGTFTSDTTANGTISVTLTQIAASACPATTVTVTWTAQRQ